MNTYSEVVEVCQRLIQAKSYSGEEGQVAKVLEETMIEFGFDQVDVDKYGNVVGTIYGKEDGPVQLYDAHMDTVPVPDASKWTHDPFGGAIEDGKVFGRGTSDMKGALAAMLVGARNFAQETDRHFKGTICVAGVCHEECFEGVAAREISKNHKPDYVVIGEASHLNLKHGQRGRAEVVIETFGKPAHSANPEHGVNAVYQMAEVINAVKLISPVVDENLGKGILVLVDVISSPYPGASVVPDYCRTTWDRRLLVGETKESVLGPVFETVSLLKEEHPNLNVKVSLSEAELICYTGEKIGDERFFPGWYYDKKEQFVASVFAALKKDGFDSVLTHYDFCTNGSHYAGEANIKTLGFGPSDEFLAHTIDEYIEIDQLDKAVKGYEIIMETLAVL
ncbi:YgeY family selenium metabolism-linked hydrolase [Pseudodesulfovibrio piezophilus]|uniref:Peptidase M20 n=1 Tax=Pseudodesulfovibrio piezophilus (strain DSM 21447 / JCM 15486 / C1TLV30) TaxID=1322246 RepID=M1WVG7_PSEP2|nr:YgeY family selenium metabolism-linked hydrolase [Pseudodesulfovibrio piezophilus]CCH48428.1 Peptidase M20 [Pseudodesulfovibrio piezophilus C1TLV30]